MTTAVQITDATPADAPAIAAILGAWNRDTAWMPKLHSPAEDLGFAQHLIASRTTRVLRAPDVIGFLARAGEEVEALYMICRVCGSPNPETWPDVVMLPGWIACRKEMKENRLKKVLMNSINRARPVLPL